MPWIETCVEDERLAFVAALLAGEAGMTALCERHGISRKTGYKWVGRYRGGGPGGLVDLSRARPSSGNGMAGAVAAAVLELRRTRPSWGPKKLKAWLARERPDQAWPAASSMGALLARSGLVVAPRRRRGIAQERRRLAVPVLPNERWCIDFKGWFRTGDGRRCDPLTVSDAASRYILGLDIIEPRSAAVDGAVDRLFQAYGLPERLLMDNGPPFASTGAGGLTRLAVKWLKLGIDLERIRPGKPQDNGRHERMHRTLKAETSRPAAADRAEQQARFDRFRADFNGERPHEALGQAVPASRWQPSPRAYPSRLPEPWYDADHQVRRVRPTGEIRWRGGSVFVSEALAGEPVGLARLSGGDWLLRFCAVELGRLGRDGRFRRFRAERSWCPEDERPVDLLDGATAPPTTPQAPTTATSVTHVPGPDCHP